MPRPLIPDRRNRILEAAEALILERGFDAASVQAIAERAGIAKGAVYREFASKNDILDTLLRRAMSRVVETSQKLVGDGLPRLSTAYRVGARALLDDPLMTAALLDDEGVLGTYTATVTDGRYRARHLAVVEWIQQVQKSGALDPHVDAAALGLALSSTTLGLLTAAKLLGPLTRAQLEAALGAMEYLVSRLEPPANDGPSSRTGEGR